MASLPLRRRFAVTSGSLLVLVAIVGCDASDPVRPPDSGAWHRLPASAAGAPFPAAAGASQWTVRDDPAGPVAKIRLLTEIRGEEFRWRWIPPLGVREQRRILEPLDPGLYHTQTVGAGCAPGPPLPIQPVDSAAYPHLLSLLQDLSDPLFGQVVVHWPELPVPVRAGNAVAGVTDLSACLAQAVAVWNEGAAAAWFRLDESAGWGVRLVHLPDVRLSPPLEIRLTRRADDGAPLRMNLMAGNNYDDLRDPVYAVRGLVHELGHALLLWGHTSDRRHSLWGAAPPLVAEPSADERKAALLWHGLPVGLDLSLYR